LGGGEGPEKAESKTKSSIAAQKEGDRANPVRGVMDESQQGSRFKRKREIRCGGRLRRKSLIVSKKEGGS